MADRAQNFGHAVVAGEVQYFSPSSLTVADPSQYSGCLRRWFFKYVLGKKEPFTASQKKGVEVHSEIETYLRTGDKFLGSIAMAGKCYIPEPGPTNEIEFSMVQTQRVGEIDRIVQAPLTAAGVPVVGFGDLLIRNAATYVDEEGEARPNRPNTVEPIDWKSTSSLDNAKPGITLADTVQMVSYGEWAARTNGTPVDWVRLSHVYFLTKGRPEAIKRTTLVPREQIAARWEQVQSVARSAIDVARETDAGKVPGNRNACGAWRGCPHADYCTIKSETTLDDLLGPTLSKEITVSMAAKLALLGTPPAAAPPAVSLDFKAQLAALKAEEAAALAAKSVPAAPPALPLPQGFAEALAFVQKGTMGMPGMGPVVAQCFAQATGTAFAGELKGTGMLAAVTLVDPAQMLQLAAELGMVAPAPAPTPPVAAPAPAPAPAGVLPPDAPASDPALAAKPLEAPAAPVGGSPVAEGKKRGRPAKAVVGPNSPIAQDVPDEGETRIYLNALPPAGTAYQALGTYIDALCASLASDFGTGDVRCAPKGTPLEFGGWKGVVAAVARKAPPAAGTYVLITRTEIDDIIADALKDFIVATGVR